MKRIIHEIHRRSLWQVLGIYLAGSRVALQEAGIALDRGMNVTLLWDPEPAFDRLRNDPRFVEIRAGVQRRWEAEREKIAAREGIPLPSGG